jgi:hypothetical protein
MALISQNFFKVEEEPFCSLLQKHLISIPTDFVKPFQLVQDNDSTGT